MPLYVTVIKMVKTMSQRIAIGPDGILIKIIKTGRNFIDYYKINIIYKDLDNNKFSENAKTAPCLFFFMFFFCFLFLLAFVFVVAVVNVCLFVLFFPVDFYF